MKTLERYRGSLIGLAVGDALGTTLEFQPPGTFSPIDDIIGGGPFNLIPGEWTDDTSMALCLGTSLVECNGFNPADQLERYVRWYREGYLSSTGACFDIGNTVRSALEEFERTKKSYCGPTNAMSAGNGSIMRLAPVPMFYAPSPREAIERAAESSRTTHGAQESVDACRYFAAIILGALDGVSKEELLADHYEPVKGVWESAPLAPKIAGIASGSFKRKDPPKIRGRGYVVDALEAALWAFDRSDSFRAGALLAVNLGDDADTTGAIYGQVAGAFYGEKGIPEKWRAVVAHRSLIEAIAEKLYEQAVGRK